MSLPPAAPGLSPRARRAWLLALVLVTLIAWLPALSLSAGLAIASLTGCQVHEGFAQPCQTWAGDIGGLLYGMTVMGWFLLITLPLMLITLAPWLVLGVIWLWRRFR